MIVIRRRDLGQGELRPLLHLKGMLFIALIHGRAAAADSIRPRPRGPHGDLLKLLVVRGRLRRSAPSPTRGPSPSRSTQTVTASSNGKSGLLHWQANLNSGSMSLSTAAQAEALSWQPRHLDTQAGIRVLAVRASNQSPGPTGGPPTPSPTAPACRR